MEMLVILSYLLCVVYVACQSQSVTTDCASFFEACDQVYEASQKDMSQVNDYYQCLKRPQNCEFFQEEDKERRIVRLRIFVANVCPSCRLGDKVWATSTQTPDEMPDETCENQIFTCTTHSNDSMTRFDMLYETFVCVQRPAECSAHEEFLRQAVTSSIVNEMAMACPDCLVPNIPSSMFMRGMHPEQMSCMSVLTLCNAKFNVKGRNYRSFESLYMCIAKITNCESDMEQDLRQQQMDVLVMTLKGMCPTCTMPTPRPPEQHTCLESVYYCSAHGIDESFTVRHNALRKVHECAMELDECDSSGENNLRYYLVHHVRIEMERECRHCNIPDVPNDLMTSIDNAVPPENLNCREAITLCQSVFNIRPRHQWRYEAMYHCVQRAGENCTPEEMEWMERTAPDLQPLLQRKKRSALPSTESKPLLASRIQAVELTPCHYDIFVCKQEFQIASGNCRNRLKYLTCLTALRNCQALEEQMRMLHISEQLAIVQKECTIWDMNSGHEANWPFSTCYPAFSSCSRVFYSSNKGQRRAVQFYQCLMQPQKCNDWEESYRREMLQAAQNYIPTSGIEQQFTSAGSMSTFHGIILASLTSSVWILIQAG